MKARTAKRRLMALHDRMAALGHDLPVRLWDGTDVGPDDRGYRLLLHHPGSLRAMLLPPTDLAIGEAFLADEFDVEGSMVAAITDVAALRADLGPREVLRLGADVLRLPRTGRVEGHDRAARLGGELHSKERDAAAIRHHYDVGHDFYRLFLDDSLVYSCAYFLPGDDDLERAQIRKLDVVCRKLRLAPGMRLLDIGCGWGGLVMHAAETYGVTAVGVTLSEDQVQIAKERVAARGLDDRVEIRLQDYRDVTGTFDAVASIGMVEHVGADQLSTYFTTAYERTAPGGRFLNHGITTGLRREIRDLSKVRSSFVGRYVFPDGALVPASRAVAELQDAGFELLDVEQLRPNYARTLEHWTGRLEAAHDEAAAMVGEPTYRVWRAYMAGSAVGFHSRDLGVIQVLGGRQADNPFGRDWMLPTG